MNAFLAAAAYFTRRSFANRLKTLRQRLKNPRYLFGFIAVCFYFWFFVIRNLSVDSVGEGGGGSFKITRWALTGLYLLQIFTSWVFGAQGRALAFRESEVDVLFQAPLSRPHILLFKLLQLQSALVLSSLFMAILTLRVGTLSAPAFAVGLWINGNLLYLHGLLVTLTVRVLGKRGGAWKALSRLPAAIFLGGLLASFGMAFQDAGGMPGIDGPAVILEHPWVEAFLAPLSPLIDLLTARTVPAFLSAAIIPVVAALVHWALLVVIDFRFEDFAVETARKVTGLKTQGLDALRKKGDFVVKSPSGWFELKPTGSTWSAFVWKNTISIGRMRRRAFIAIVAAAAMVCIMAFVGMQRGGESNDSASVIGFLIVIGTLYASLLAPAILRVDLRLDIPHFDVIKALPVRGRDLIIGEILGPVFVVWAIQVFLFVFASTLVTELGRKIIGWDLKAPILISALFGLFAINLALFTGENLLAIFLPSFVRLGKGVRAGMDQFGQNILGALVRLLGLLVLGIVPAILCAVSIIVGLQFDLSPAVAVMPGVILASLAIVAECGLLVLLAEKRYDSFDLSGENVQAE